jgi:hypothetical protein
MLDLDAANTGSASVSDIVDFFCFAYDGDDYKDGRVSEFGQVSQVHIPCLHISTCENSTCGEVI